MSSCLLLTSCPEWTTVSWGVLWAHVQSARRKLEESLSWFTSLTNLLCATKAGWKLLGSRGKIGISLQCCIPFRNFCDSLHMSKKSDKEHQCSFACHVGIFCQTLKNILLRVCFFSVELWQKKHVKRIFALSRSSSRSGRMGDAYKENFSSGTWQSQARPTRFACLILLPKTSG